MYTASKALLETQRDAGVGHLFVELGSHRPARHPMGHGHNGYDHDHHPKHGHAGGWLRRKPRGRGGIAERGSAMFGLGQQP